MEGLKVAIKIPRASPVNSERNIKVLPTFSLFNDTLTFEQEFLQEVHVWSKLDHANILPLLGITTKFNLTVSIVSPWMKNGNARDYVRDEAIDPRPLVSTHQGGVINLNTTQIEGIAKGLHYLHSHTPHPIFHGDMKGVGLVCFTEIVSV